ncbi:class II lanthipeptide, LchA2/BrtA2 family [Paenibacillus sp. FSL K6-1217]|uniref:class II lanthipeptide, LchA2/BrtA2 family n=1 Tax=Paenibacillus sp. FSL K6-1217 TaxID=2921466 RepID=UPI00324B689F
MKNLQVRNEFLKTSTSVGVVSEEELKMLTGGTGDVNPETATITTSSWTCITAGVTVSAALCPTTKCTSRC